MKFGYLAFPGFDKELAGEIKFKTKKQATQLDRLFLFDEELDLVWAQLKLKDLQLHEVESISNAAKILKQQKKEWASYSFQLHRRTELIQEQVYKIKEKPYNFMQKIPERDWGFWCLFEEKKLLTCLSTGNPLPLGEIKFNEDQKNPPSRAYLKLWEAFTVHCKPPKKNEVAIDLGSCPGGWSWVLQTLGAKVISVDKAPLDSKIAKLKNIDFIKKDAFKLNPNDVKKPDWLLSDIICEPIKLYELVNNWLSVYPDLKCLCTIKYKGRTDFETTELFKEIPNSRIIHLNHNKHEVTWMKDA